MSGEAVVLPVSDRATFSQKVVCTLISIGQSGEWLAPFARMHEGDAPENTLRRDRRERYGHEGLADDDKQFADGNAGTGRR